MSGGILVPLGARVQQRSFRTRNPCPAGFWLHPEPLTDGVPAPAESISGGFPAPLSRVCSYGHRNPRPQARGGRSRTCAPARTGSNERRMWSGDPGHPSALALTDAAQRAGPVRVPGGWGRGLYARPAVGAGPARPLGGWGGACAPAGPSGLCPTATAELRHARRSHLLPRRPVCPQRRSQSIPLSGGRFCRGEPTRTCSWSRRRPPGRRPPSA